MITTLAHARSIIARHYGAEFKYRILHKAVTFANPPVADIAAGKLHLAWFRLSPGQDSAIRIGCVAGDGPTVDWSWEETRETVIGYDGIPYGVGDRVELHPGCDLWMRGARLGTVHSFSLTPNDRVKVRMDHPQVRNLVGGSEDTFRKTQQTRD